MNTLYSNIGSFGRLTVVVAALFTTGGLHADTLQLKNGLTLKGTYTGGTSSTVTFTTDAGQQTVASSEVATLTFDKPAVSPTQPASPAPAVSPAQPTKVTVAAGTTLLVTMLDQVSSSDDVGKVFRTKLLFDLTEGNVVVAPAGTMVMGRIQSATEAKRVRGKSSLDIRLSEMSVSGRKIPIATEGYEEAGDASMKKVAKSAAAGAIVGAITGDAGTGAAIGAGVGVLRKGQSITIPAGTMLEFKLAQPFTTQSP
jgi:hypothetical protein